MLQNCQYLEHCDYYQHDRSIVVMMMINDHDHDDYVDVDYSDDFTLTIIMMTLEIS